MKLWIKKFDVQKNKLTLQAPEIILSHLRQHFSYEDRNLAFIRRRYGKTIPVRQYFINLQNQIAEPLWEVVVEVAQRLFPQLICNTDCVLYENFLKQLKRFKHVDVQKWIQTLTLFSQVVPRYYQVEALQAALKHGRGLLILPTSAGKSLIIAFLAAFHQRQQQKVFIVVPNIQLVEQLYNDFQIYGFIDMSKVSRWTGRYQPNFDADILIANTQILMSKNIDISILKTKFPVLIVDEVHKFATAKQQRAFLLQGCFFHRYGLTGSLPLEDYLQWKIFSYFGPVRYQISSEQLRNEQYIASVYVCQFFLHYDVHDPCFRDFLRQKQKLQQLYSFRAPTKLYHQELLWLFSNSFRNQTICRILEKFPNKNLLILVDWIQHGQLLCDFLTQYFQNQRKVFFIHGKIDVSVREQIRSLLEQQTNVLCIAISKIFSTGISITNLHGVMFASIGKSHIKIIQSIGRSLRLNKTKKFAVILDICDSSLNYQARHASMREQLYRAEKIPILSKDIFQSKQIVEK